MEEREIGQSLVGGLTVLKVKEEITKNTKWGGRREEGSGWGTHVNLWRIHFDIWQN